MTRPIPTDAKRFRSPAAYVQGEGVLASLSEHTRPLRDPETAYILGGATALDRTSDVLITELESVDISVTVEAGVDRCTPEYIKSHTRRASECGADVVIGVGGGTVLDVAKAVGEGVACDVMTVPTVASTDAPCSAVSIVYDSDSTVTSPRFHARNPALVLVDTEVLAAAPERFLRYGIGDALSTKFEAEAVTRANGRTDAYGSSSCTADLLASATYECLIEDGSDALSAAAEGTVTPAFERVIEAVVLRSGLGFESGGVAAAHAFYNGAVECGSDRPHGELVCFGTIVQLELENRTTALGSVSEFCSEVGLKVTLDDIGIADVSKLARTVAESPLMENEPISVTPSCIMDSIQRADEQMRSISEQ